MEVVQINENVVRTLTAPFPSLSDTASDDAFQVGDGLFPIRVPCVGLHCAR